MRVKYASSDLLYDEDASQIFNQWKRVQSKSILRFSNNKNESRIIVYFRYFPIMHDQRVKRKWLADAAT